MTIDYIAEVANEGLSFTSSTLLNNISGTSEHPYLLIRNPVAAARRILITHYSVFIDATTARSILMAYKNPTITSNGSSLSVVNTYAKTSPETSEITIFKDPILSDNGSFLNMTGSKADTDSRGINRYYWCDPGNDLLFTVQNSISNSSVNLSIIWVELSKI